MNILILTLLYILPIKLIIKCTISEKILLFYSWVIFKLSYFISYNIHNSRENSNMRKIILLFVVSIFILSGIGAVSGNEFDKLIGDGIVIATPFGSTGYYKSTGGKQFKKGIGISFNNLHNRKLESFVVSERSTINVKVHRGPAWIIADNNEKFLDLRTKDIVTVKKSEDTANFICVP